MLQLAQRQCAVDSRLLFTNRETAMLSKVGGGQGQEVELSMEANDQQSSNI